MSQVAGYIIFVAGCAAIYGVSWLGLSHLRMLALPDIPWSPIDTIECTFASAMCLLLIIAIVELGYVLYMASHP